MKFIGQMAKDKLDSVYESGKLVLQETEINEALWPKTKTDFQLKSFQSIVRANLRQRSAALKNLDGASETTSALAPEREREEIRIFSTSGANFNLVALPLYVASSAVSDLTAACLAAVKIWSPLFSAASCTDRGRKNLVLREAVGHYHPERHNIPLGQPTERSFVW
jgi:hypothetical protein